MASPLELYFRRNVCKGTKKQHCPPFPGPLETTTFQQPPPPPTSPTPNPALRPPRKVHSPQTQVVSPERRRSTRHRAEARTNQALGAHLHFPHILHFIRSSSPRAKEEAESAPLGKEQPQAGALTQPDPGVQLQPSSVPTAYLPTLLAARPHQTLG